MKSQKVQHFLDTFSYIKRYFIVAPDGSPYIERLVLPNDTYLHIIYSSDGDRDPHDHPWDFESTILSGAYIEHAPVVKDGKIISWHKRRYGPGEKNNKKARAFHRLEVVEAPVITLVKLGKRERVWGFLTSEGWKPYNEYLDEKFGPGNWTDVEDLYEQ